MSSSSFMIALCLLFSKNVNGMPSGLDPLSAGLLFGGLGLSAAFLFLVMYLDSRPKLVMRLINKKLIDDQPEATAVI